MDHGVNTSPVVMPIIIALDPPPEPLELLERLTEGLGEDKGD